MSRTNPRNTVRNLNVKNGFLLDGVSVTATAAELNAVAGGGLSAAELGFLDGVVAGTATASKAAVLGTNKNLDVLALPVSGLKIGAGAGTAVTASAAELNQLTGATVTAAQLTALAAAAGTVTFDRSVKIARAALAALDTGGGVLSWVNPEAGSIIVNRVVFDVTTDASAACTIDVGTTAVSATTTSDNLIDGADVGTAAGVIDNLGDAGTNGKTRQKLATGKWITASMASGAAAGLVGFAYIHYNLI